MEPWEILDERRVYQNKHWLTVREQKLRLPNGHIIEDYLVTDVPEVAMIFAVTVDQEVLLVEQYRHGPRRPMLNLPAGYIEAGEDPFETARRELQEETGYGGGEWRAMGAFYFEQNRHGGKFYYYLATSTHPVGDTHFDITEDIRSHKVPLKDLRDYVDDGRVEGVHSIAGIYRGLDLIARL